MQAIRRYAAACVAAEREARQEAQRRVAELQARINKADRDQAIAVAKECERCAKLIEDYELSGWHGGSGYHAGLKCAARLLRA